MWILGIPAVLAAVIVGFILLHPAFGGRPDAAERARMRASPRFHEGRFANAEPTPMVFGEKGSFWKVMGKFLRGVEKGRPRVVETAPFDAAAFLAAPGDLVVTWFGHSTVLLRLEGRVFLLDPVFRRRASPVSFAGTLAFNYTHPVRLEDLPRPDAVLISHDHYDHLERESVTALAKQGVPLYVPLGVKGHLRRWGVAAERVTVADWWDGFSLGGGVHLTAVPARHFSGRSPFRRNATLWCGWVIRSPRVRVFFSGDSGYGAHFREIGRRCGPFDLTLVECGQYNRAWAWLHAFPEQAVRAHRDLRGKWMLPIHWGRFRISTHAWDEPPRRARREARRLGVNLLIPRINAVVPVPPPESGAWRWDIGGEG